MKYLRGISAAQFAAIILFFFMSFLDVSCANMVHIKITGMQLATGSTIQIRDPMSGNVQSTKLEREPKATLALGAASLGVMASALPDMLGRAVCGALGASGVGLLLLLKSAVDSEIMRNGGGILSVEYEFGFWGALLLFLTATGTNVFAIFQPGTTSTRRQTVSPISVLLLIGAGAAIGAAVYFKLPSKLLASPTQRSLPTDKATEQDKKLCNGSDPDGVLSGCTALIKSGTLSSDNLSIAYYRRGGAYMLKEKFDQGIQDFEASVRINPATPNALNALCFAYGRRGIRDVREKDFDSGIATCTRAMAVERRSMWPYYNRCWIYSNKGAFFAAGANFEHALADCNTAISLEPNDVSPRWLRGWVFFELQAYDSAISDFTECIRLQPNIAACYQGRAWMHSLMRSYELAMADWSVAINLSPDFSGAYSGRGYMYLRQGNFGPAIADFSTAIRLDEKDAYALLGRCLTRARAGDAVASPDDCDLGVKLRPRVADVLFVRGAYYLLRQKPDLALGDARTALSIKPDHAESLFVRGVAYLHKGDEGQSDADIRAAKAIRSDIMEYMAEYYGVAP